VSTRKIALPFSRSSRRLIAMITGENAASGRPRNTRRQAPLPDDVVRRAPREFECNMLAVARAFRSPLLSPSERVNHAAWGGTKRRFHSEAHAERFTISTVCAEPSEKDRYLDAQSSS